MIEDALRNKLLSNSALSALIGDRIYVLQAPQGVQGNYVVYLIVSEQGVYTATDHCDEIIIQYSCFAEKYADARLMAKTIRAELDNFYGELEGLFVVSIRFDGRGANEREKDSRKAHVSYDFRIILNKS
ncbi:DUF3168 domain-containing protein [Emticicia fontis]